MSKLDEIRERWEKATPGPWKAHDFGYGGMEEPCSIVIHTGKFDWQDINGEGTSVIASMLWDSQEADNADAIAHAREDVPWLLAKIDRLDEQVKRIQKTIRPTGNPMDTLAEFRKLTALLNEETP